MTFYGHDAIVTVSVDGLESPVGFRVAGPVAVRPGRRTGILVQGEATMHPCIGGTPGSLLS